MTQNLDRECDTFCRAIAQFPAPPAVLSDYARAHSDGVLLAPAGVFDPLLVRIARTAPFFARVADSYAVLFARNTLLRRKLILLLAILESHADTSRRIDAPRAQSLTGFAGGAALLVLGFTARVLLAFPVLAPIQALCSLAGRAR